MPTNIQFKWRQHVTKKQYENNRRGIGFDRPRENGGGTCSKLASQFALTFLSQRACSQVVAQVLQTCAFQPNRSSLTLETTIAFAAARTLLFFWLPSS